MAFVRVLIALAAFAAAGTGAAAIAQPLTAVGQLEPGRWQLRTRGAPTRDICVADPATLIQLEHSRTSCSRLVVANERSTSTVQYSCPGAGWGRTTVRVSTPRAATIDTQGIAANMPFAYVADAHRTGECAAESASLSRR